MPKKLSSKKLLQGRIKMRRINLAIQFLFVIASIVVIPILDKLGRTPNWIGTPLYAVIVALIVFLIYAFFWIWIESGEKNEVDQLLEITEKGFGKLTDSVDNLANEIREDRNGRNNKPSQQLLM
jgi:hypothetical protein